MNKITVLLIAFMAAIGPLSTDIYLPGLPNIAVDLGTNASGGQLSLTACFLGLAIGQIIIGPWSDGVGRRKPAILSFLGFAITSFLCSTATSLPMFLLWRFVQGLAGAGCIVLARSIASDRFSGNELTRFIALLVLISSVVPIAGPIIGGFILEHFKWPYIFMLLTVAGVIGSIGVLWQLPETLPLEQRIEGGLKTSIHNMSTLWQNKAYRGYLLVQGFTAMGLFGYIGAAPFIMEEIYGLSPSEFSLFFGLGSASFALAAQISGRISKAFGEPQILKIGIGLGGLIGCGLLIASFIQPETPYLVGGLLLGLIFSCGINLPLSFSCGMNSHIGIAGSASGLLGVMAFLAGAIASPLVGLGGGHSMWPLAVLVMIVHGLAIVAMKQVPLDIQ